MDLTALDIKHKQFRTRWKGFDPQEIEVFLQEVSEGFGNLSVENAELKERLQETDRELREHKEREKTIRNVLLSAHKTVEQMKANAEKEAQLIISDAELKADKLVQSAHRTIAELREEISELKRQKLQLSMKLRSAIETHLHLLDLEKEEEEAASSEESLKASNS